MRRKTLYCLEEFIIKGLYDGFVNKPFITLFKNYTNKEVKNINDFLIIADAYVKFVLSNKDGLLKTFSFLTEDELKDELNTIISAVNAVKYEENKRMQNNYVRMIEYFINRKSRVLDVGAGKIPFSSFMIAKNKAEVSAMDKFVISDELISKFKVDSKNEFFTTGTDVKDFDMVVGLKPCGAIGQIVEVCQKENKPYFLHLCNCGATEYALSKFRVMVGDWKRILPELDPNVKFANVYATNLDISQDKLKKIIFRKCRMTREMQSCGMIEFMESFQANVGALSKDVKEDEICIPKSNNIGYCGFENIKTEEVKEEICEK